MGGVGAQRSAVGAADEERRFGHGGQSEYGGIDRPWSASTTLPRDDADVGEVGCLVALAIDEGGRETERRRQRVVSRPLNFRDRRGLLRS